MKQEYYFCVFDVDGERLYACSIFTDSAFRVLGEAYFQLNICSEACSANVYLVHSDGNLELLKEFIKEEL